MENNKLKSDILYSEEKLHMALSQIDAYKKEIDHVRDSCQRYSSSLHKMQVADEGQRQVRIVKTNNYINTGFRDVLRIMGCISIHHRNYRLCVNDMLGLRLKVKV